MTYYELTNDQLANDELTDQELSQVSGGFIELYPWWREGWVWTLHNSYSLITLIGLINKSIQLRELVVFIGEDT